MADRSDEHVDLFNQSMFTMAYAQIDASPIYLLPIVPWPEKNVPVPAPTVVGHAPAMNNMMLAAGTYAEELAAARGAPKPPRQVVTPPEQD